MPASHSKSKNSPGAHAARRPVPVNTASIGKFYQHLQRAMLKVWDTYSATELRLLLRFATQGYETMLAATEEFKAMIEDAEGKRAGAKKPARAP
jgi:hypothetical protein